ncbi:MAG: hypothetical protein M0D55_16675 [Elusimicrobiota bacterium]|nr:MAG: hypothetical protein M0D55_16675 [Elusimicrobiota bacterium]
MRKLAALFMALAVSASAQTKVGVTVQPGLGGTPLAPVPGVALSPAALTPGLLPAASLTPTLGMVAPAPALAASIVPAASKAVPEAAKAVVPGARASVPAALTPAALAAITPAASNPEKPGSQENVAAANALFDGASARPAASISDDGSGVVGGPQSDRSRASGLSPPADAEIAAAWKEARPKSKAIDTFGAAQFVAAASEAVQKYTFMGEHFLQQMSPRGESMLDFRGRAIYRAASDFIGAHDDRDNPASVKFMKLLGRWMAFHDSAREAQGALQMKLAAAAGMRMRGHKAHLTPSPIEGGEYWDMAAGMNALGFIHRELDPRTNYSFFDYSPYVASYLAAAAEIAGKPNAKVVEGDIGALKKPAKPVAVLRTKNAVHYVPGFAAKLEEMADWIAPGGQLVIQNDPNPGQRALIREGHGALIQRLVSEGWKMEYGFSGRPGSFSEYGLDTLILTRPKSAATAKIDPSSAWRAYNQAVAKVDSEPDMNSLFAMLFGGR